MLTAAAERNDLTVLEKLLLGNPQEFDINGVNKKGYTSLQIAANNNNEDFLCRLLGVEGIDVNKQGGSVSTCFCQQNIICC